MILKSSTYFYRSFLIVLISVFASIQVYGQEEEQNADTLIIAKDHSVYTGTIRSTIIPGWGQIYNKKYWKVPLVYAALGTTVYFAIDNHTQYRKYIDAFELRVDDDPTTIDQFDPSISTENLIILQDQYRKWRDLSLILTGLGYALNIIDAHVDAHLFYYDVSDDLSLNWKPTIIQNPYYNSIGVSVKFDIK